LSCFVIDLASRLLVATLTLDSIVESDVLAFYDSSLLRSISRANMFL